jgi:hypothetical protein
VIQSVLPQLGLHYYSILFECLLPSIALTCHQHRQPEYFPLKRRLKKEIIGEVGLKTALSETSGKVV